MATRMYCECGEKMYDREHPLTVGEDYSPIIASHCRVCHYTVKAGDPCACMEEASDDHVCGYVTIETSD